MPAKTYEEAKENWENKVRLITRTTREIKKSLILKPSKDNSDDISLISEEEESFEF